MIRAIIISNILLFLVLIGCNPDPVNPFSIPDEVLPFVESFEEEAAKRGVSLVIDELIVEYGTELESSSGGEAIGQCFVPNSRNPIPRIVIDTASFAWKQNEFSRELLMFHELGHCILDRLDHRDDRLSNGNFASLMLTSSNNLYGPKLNNFKREYYIDELFDINTPEPDWAKDIPAYEDLTAAKVRKFIDEFDDNRFSWPFNFGGETKGSIADGQFQFASDIPDQALSTAIQLALDQGLDYEIELDIKIESGENLALFQWGGTREAGDFFFAGFSRDGFFFGGQWGIGSASTLELPDFDPDGFNKLTIRKIGQFYYIYANETFAEIYEVEELPGNLIGFFVGSQTSMKVDYLRINELR
ncbi:MAG: hypothetical protein MRZ79_02085 [Bacteroidia bacterium]|nr:hypothetical protein [Bacteroidia bacterium]